MFLLIEEIEGQWATIEWGKENFRIPKFLLPGSAKKGDKININIILHQDGGRLRRGTSNAIYAEDYDDLE